MNLNDDEIWKSIWNWFLNKIRVETHNESQKEQEDINITLFSFSFLGCILSSTIILGTNYAHPMYILNQEGQILQGGAIIFIIFSITSFFVSRFLSDIVIIWLIDRLADVKEVRYRSRPDWSEHKKIIQILFYYVYVVNIFAVLYWLAYDSAPTRTFEVSDKIKIERKQERHPRVKKILDNDSILIHSIHSILPYDSAICNTINIWQMKRIYPDSLGKATEDLYISVADVKCRLSRKFHPSSGRGSSSYYYIGLEFLNTTKNFELYPDIDNSNLNERRWALDNYLRLILSHSLISEKLSYHLKEIEDEHNYHKERLKKGCYDLGYIDFLYFSSITITTVGYGDIYPINTSIRIFVILEAFVSVILITFGLSLFFSKKL